MSKFSDFKINDLIIKALTEQEILEPTEVQEKVIPIALDGKDVVAKAPTGTGKTLSYVLPIIEKVDRDSNKVQALIICPTRELVIQICDVFKMAVKYYESFRVAGLYGGQNLERQLMFLRKKPQVIVGTPGRLLDHLDRRTLKLQENKVLVLDEGDEMFDMGFRNDIEKIMAAVPQHTTQKMLFSATIPNAIKTIVEEKFNEPEFVETTLQGETIPQIKQYYTMVKDSQRVAALLHIKKINKYSRCIVFCNTKSRADKLYQALLKAKQNVAVIHSDIRQNERTRIMKAFKEGKTEILVATDVAARGIDVDEIKVIFNFDPPADSDFYVHRIGRTARAGSYGVAITFATSHSRRQIADLEKYIHHNIQVLDVPTVEDIKAKRQKNLYLRINEKMESLEDTHKYDSLIMKLSKQSKDPMPLINALLEMVNTNERVYNDIQSVTFKSKESNKKGNKKDSKKEKAKGFSDSKEKCIISVNVGKNDNVRPNQLVVYFHDELKIHREHFGKIVIKDAESFIEINSDALRFFKDLHKHRFNGRRIDYKKVDKMPK